MTLVDYEALVLELEQYITSRTGHGKQALLAKLAELRHTHRIEEGLPERALRLYGVEFGEVLRQIADQSPSVFVASGDGETDEASARRERLRPPEGDQNGTGSTTHRSAR